MSYDLYLMKNMQVCHTETPHHITGGTYEAGGSTKLWLNITYNYSPYFYRVFGEKGIRALLGLTGAASIPVLEAAMVLLKDDVTDNYWEATEGNAKKALQDLVALAKLCPDGIWAGG